MIHIHLFVCLELQNRIVEIGEIHKDIPKIRMHGYLRVTFREGKLTNHSKRKTWNRQSESLKYMDEDTVATVRIR